MRVHELLRVAVENQASDVLLSVGIPPVLRRHGKLMRLDQDRLAPADTEALLFQLLTEEQRQEFQAKGQISASYGVFGTGRFRLCGFRQRGTVAMAIRVIPSTVRPSLQATLPEVVLRLALCRDGLVIVCGPPAGGKTTTLAGMVQAINANRSVHIVTIEEPIEYLHRHDKSIINQREVGTDTPDFLAGLGSALRQTADVIVLGDFVPAVTQAAVDAASAGPLVLTAMIARSAAEALSQTVYRLPPARQEQIRDRLATSLRGVAYQQLVPRADGTGEVAAFEVLTVTPPVRELIRAGNWAEVQAMIDAPAEPDSVSLDRSLQSLADRGLITAVEAEMRSATGRPPA